MTGGFSTVASLPEIPACSLTRKLFSFPAEDETTTDLEIEFDLGFEGILS